VGGRGVLLLIFFLPFSLPIPIRRAGEEPLPSDADEERARLLLLFFFSFFVFILSLPPSSDNLQLGKLDVRDRLFPPFPSFPILSIAQRAQAITFLKGRLVISPAPCFLLSFLPFFFFFLSFSVKVQQGRCKDLFFFFFPPPPSPAISEQKPFFPLFSPLDVRPMERRGHPA